MRIVDIYLVTKNLILEPQKALEKIYSKSHSKSKVIFDYLLPMASLIAASSLIGSIFNGSIKDTFSIGYIFFNCVISFVIIFLEVYLSALLISEIARTYNPESDTHRIFNLVIYSHAPFYLSISFIKIFPQLFFLIIAGFYSFYIFWRGIELFSGLKHDKKNIFMFLSLLIMITLYILLTLIFNNIYDGIINGVSTFVG